jgi:hypothetical protein
MTRMNSMIAPSTRVSGLFSSLARFLQVGVPQLHNSVKTCHELPQKLYYDVGLSDCRFDGTNGVSPVRRLSDIDREMMRRSF